ncbi:hypothetical protein [Methylobacterium sp. JK268]
MAGPPQLMLILGLLTCASIASVLISWRTLQHLRRSERRAAESLWSLHASRHAAPEAHGQLFYIRLSDPARNRFRIGYVRVRHPRGATVSAAEVRPSGGYAHLAYRPVLSPNCEIHDRKRYEPGAGPGDHPGEGRLHFFVAPPSPGLWRRARPERLIVEVGVEAVTPGREARRLRLTSDPVMWERPPVRLAAAQAPAPGLSVQAAE